MAHGAILGFTMAAAGMLLTAWMQPHPAQDNPPKAKAQQPIAATQPATTQPASAPRTMRKPEQVEIIESLLRDRQRSSPILPQDPQAAVGAEVTTTQPAGAAEGPGLLADGATLVERPGRMVVEDGKPRFVFYAGADEPKLHTMDILPNQLLEALEREVQRGSSEFVISAEVTRYQGRNYLLLRKILRRVGHGNLAP
jgi:hypothetical protein